MLRFFLIAWVAGSSTLLGQTTQGTLEGLVRDSIDGHVLAGALITCENESSGVTRTAISGSGGDYSFLQLSPGTYQLSVSAANYVHQEIQNFEIHTASQNRQPFYLRPLADVWETKEKRNLQTTGGRAVLPLVGPDLGPGYEVSLAAQPLGSEALIPTVSTVVDARQLSALPLAGRDIYSLLIGLGGVNSDAGSGRGLGLTVSGQRTTASSFHLDGLENNNQLTTGVEVSLAPEAIEEYRVSLAHFTAEYGGTSGYLANAVTRESAIAWRGSVYAYLRNEAINANSFRRNDASLPRAANRELDPGFYLSGPLWRHKAGLSVFFESVGNRGEGEPQTLELPSASYIFNTDPSGDAAKLLKRFSFPLVAAQLPVVTIGFRPDRQIRRSYGMVRTDQSFRSQTVRLFERIVANRTDQSNFIWSPYPDFSSPLRQDDVLGGVSASWTPRPNLLHELHAGLAYDSLGWFRAFPEIPTLTAFPLLGTNPAVLPGSPAAYGYRNLDRNLEVSYGLTILHGSQTWKVGSEVLLRRPAGSLTFGRDGRYDFSSIFDFLLNWPASFTAGVSRNSATLQIPVYESRFKSHQLAGFAQNEWRATRNLTISLGLRYEYFGPPVLDGDTHLLTVGLGSGSSFPERLENATLQTLAPGSAAYSSDNNDLSVRTGLSYRFGQRGPVLRGSFGTFYSRPFDNLWQNLRMNSVQLASVVIDRPGTDFLKSPSAALAQSTATRADFPELLLYQPGIRDPYSMNHFLGISSTFGDFWQWEVNQIGSMSRKLISTDQINRQDSVPSTPANVYGFIQPDLPAIAYRANQGSSSFEGLNLVLRRRSANWLLQASYTWSHAIDNQSDPLAGDFLDLSFTRNAEADPTRAIAAFSNQFDSRADRGNSDFDQRQNLVLFASWNVPSLHGAGRTMTGGWKISWLGAIRSGLPYTVFAPPGDTNFYNRRADYLGGTIHADSSVAGGVQLLNPAAFAIPSGNQQGNLGRNSLVAPGFYTLDVSLAKSFHPAALPETVRFTVRADAYNILNRANLDRPFNVVSQDNFGEALYGRNGVRSSFPAATPLDEAPRQLQFGIRIDF